MRNLERYWINQPGVYQPMHHRNGENVLVDFTVDIPNCRIYFTSGEVVSQIISPLFLSEGWTTD